MLDSRIASILREMEAFIRGRDDAMAIPRDAGEFIYALLTATGGKTGVEIGTSFGYSTIWAAAALVGQGGVVHTIDREESKQVQAADFVGRAGLSDVVRFEAGVALEVLKRAPQSIDYVLNDADKEHCVEYVEHLVGRLNPGAVILTDNTLTHPEQLGEFQAWIRGRGDFASCQVVVGNGMEMSVYSPAATRVG